jgi:hypothetical protein
MSTIHIIKFSIVRLEGIGKLKNSTSSGLDLPACSIVPQPTTLPHAPVINIILWFIFIQFSLFWKIGKRVMRSSCCLSIRLYLSLCLYTPLIFFKAYEITLLFVYPPLQVFLRRLMQSRCWLCTCVSPLNVLVSYAVHVALKQSRRFLSELLVAIIKLQGIISVRIMFRTEFSVRCDAWVL